MPLYSVRKRNFALIYRTRWRHIPDYSNLIFYSRRIPLVTEICHVIQSLSLGVGSIMAWQWKSVIKSVNQSWLYNCLSQVIIVKDIWCWVQVVGPLIDTWTRHCLPFAPWKQEQWWVCWAREVFSEEEGGGKGGTGFMAAERVEWGEKNKATKTLHLLWAKTETLVNVLYRPDMIFVFLSTRLGPRLLQPVRLPRRSTTVPSRVLSAVMVTLVSPGMLSHINWWITFRPFEGLQCRMTLKLNV